MEGAGEEGKGRVREPGLGPSRAGKGPARGRDLELTSRPSCPLLSRSPLCHPGSASSPGPASQARGGGETFSLETLDTNFVFGARKISLVWKGGGGAVSQGRGEPAAEQTLRIRFQRLRPTPSPAAVICVRGSVTLRGIKRPAGTGRVQRDSGQRGGLRQRRWFISALPARARRVCPPARAPGPGESGGPPGKPRPEEKGPGRSRGSAVGRRWRGRPGGQAPASSTEAQAPPAEQEPDLLVCPGSLGAPAGAQWPCLPTPAQEAAGSSWS